MIYVRLLGSTFKTFRDSKFHFTPASALFKPCVHKQEIWFQYITGWDITLAPTDSHGRAALFCMWLPVSQLSLYAANFILFEHNQVGFRARMCFLFSILIS